jgi:hypothetical protein
MVMVDNGTTCIGYSSCGRCMAQVKNCTCPSGPSIPAYIERWMEQKATEVTG